MNYKTRQNLIINKLKIQGEVTTKELTDEFKVSIMTIRRDLQTLENLGYVKLVHGGACWNDECILELPVSYKITEYPSEKRAIAKYCVSLIDKNSTIFIETGTTTQAVAEEFTKLQNVTIYTNSLMACNTLSKFASIELYVLPGKYRELSYGFVGSMTNQFIKNLYFDFLFVGTEGIDLEYGVSTPDTEDAMTKQSAVESSRNVVLVADHSKFGKKHAHRICGFDKIAYIITDSELDDPTYHTFKQSNINIIRVDK